MIVQHHNTGLRKAFLALREQKVEVFFRHDMAKHTNMGEARSAMALEGRAARLLAGPLERILPTDGEAVLVLNRNQTALTPSGPATMPWEFAGTIEGIADGVLRMRSKSIQGEWMRVHLPLSWIAFFHCARTIPAEEISADAEAFDDECIYELRGISPKNPSPEAPLEPPTIYVAERQIAWLVEHITVALLS